MKLLLIRHGETVDNVAGIYAGVKDSALTVHGNLQAERLGKYFAGRDLRFTYVFSSDLQRACKTAGAICDVQPKLGKEREEVEVTSLEILREQNFGIYEGKPFYARQQDSKKFGKDDHRPKHRDDPDFKDVESKQEMDKRMDTFLQHHLIPILQAEQVENDATIAIVSHGIILSHLWRCFLKLFPKNSVNLSPGLQAGTGGVTPLEYLGAWSNTGYLELDIYKDSEMAKTAAQILPSPTDNTSIATTSSFMLAGHKMIIKAVNGKEHLTGLKRTRGVSSSEFDENQKKLDTFFKRHKV